MTFADEVMPLVMPYLQTAVQCTVYVMKLIEGRHYQDGTTHEGVDPRWPL